MRPRDEQDGVGAHRLPELRGEIWREMYCPAWQMVRMLQGEVDGKADSYACRSKARAEGMGVLKFVACVCGWISKALQKVTGTTGQVQ